MASSVGSLSADEEIFISIFQKLQPCDKDKWFDHVLTTLANYEVGKAYKEKEKEEAEKEEKFKKKLKAAELRALLEAAEREEREEQKEEATKAPEGAGFLKRIAGAVGETANQFASANKTPKLGNQIDEFEVALK
ncbi:hypothetical protein CYMTET_19408 [Cymbomonas tetramitiformis]|uniref:Uncharacterized protein n=1 Tax=Cymbomonas tetramitiformis TaxID=36881 RepID=A0AAE0G6P6_9CHLO|nr:hypothetical protein CYMTET_19408 [Cymbomonas tetramitiformis]